MKNLTFGAAMALSVVASTAQAHNTAPSMMMDEMVVKNQTIEGSAESSARYIPMLMVILLLVAVASLVSDDGGMMY
jgi:hypothetical protein